MSKSYFLFFYSLYFLCFTPYKSNAQTISPIAHSTTYSVMEDICLAFKGIKNTKYQLYYKNSYGDGVLEKKAIDGQVAFMLPKAITKKKGLFSWRIIANKKTHLKGHFYLKADTLKKQTLEPYIGPRMLQVGGRDYAMVVGFVNDIYDNPLPDKTKVLIKHRFLKKQQIHLHQVKDLMVWRNIYAPNKTGKILIALEHYNTTSKQYIADVYAGNAIDFTIKKKRIHPYADGNQTTIFSTSVIKDTYGNIVEDGTFVDFTIQSKNGIYQRFFAQTIQGIATAEVLHPVVADTWQVQAKIIGLANSNTLTLDFKNSITDFKVSFTPENNRIHIGPLQSFMQQYIPDGLEVHLIIKDGDTTIETLKGSSYNGYVSFTITKAFYRQKNYTFIIKAAGITKKMNKWVH